MRSLVREELRWIAKHLRAGRPDKALGMVVWNMRVYVADLVGPPGSTVLLPPEH